MFVRENARPHEIIILIGSQILFSQLRRAKIASLKITLSKKTTLKESDSVVNDDDDNDNDGNDHDDDDDDDDDDNLRRLRCRRLNVVTFWRLDCWNCLAPGILVDTNWTCQHPSQSSNSLSINEMPFIHS